MGFLGPHRRTSQIRRSTALLLCLFVPLLVGSGCMNRDKRPGVTTITVWSMWTGQEERNFQSVLHRYEELHPNIRFHNLGAVSDDTKTIRALVAGVPPDLFTLSDPYYLGPLAHNRAIMPLDDMFRQSGLKESDFIPASLKLCRYNGRLYGLPYLIDDNALIWNKDLFREVGLDPDRPPRTIEELEEFAARLTKRDAGGTVQRLGLRPDVDPLLLMVLFGGKFVDGGGRRIIADDPGNVAGMTWLKSVIDRMGGIDAVNTFSSGFGADQGASNPFYVGKVAMMISGEWNPYWLARYAPQVSYGVAPIPPPASRPDLKDTTLLGGNVFCIPVDGKHPKEAWDFLVWTQTREAQILFAGAMNNVPNQRSAIHASELRTGRPFRPRYALFLDLAGSPNADFFPALPVGNLYRNQIVTAKDQVLYGTKTPAQALADVRKRVQKEMDEQ
jgi:multiple sugar transport system substrate-binding protein